MKLVFNACANCLHFEGDTETVRRFLQGRWQEVYLLPGAGSTRNERTPARFTKSAS